MRLDEAYQTLGLQNGASEEEVKKAFRDLLKENHPDKNSSPEAATKSKKLTEAYAVIQNPETATPEQTGIDFADMNIGGFRVQDIFNGIGWAADFFSQPPQPVAKARKLSKLTPTLELTFLEAVCGAKKPLEIERAVRCDPCIGKGVLLKESCSNCNGSGYIREKISASKNVTQYIQRPCNICGGQGRKTEQCSSCDGYGSLMDKRIFNITVPAGMTEDDKLNAPKLGHFNTRAGQYENLLIKLKIAPHPTMKLDKKDVISTVEVNLLEALEGKTVKVETILGTKDLQIPAKSKHNQIIVLPKHGVNGEGNHLFTLSVSYPEDVSKLIEILKG